MDKFLQFVVILALAIGVFFLKLLVMTKIWALAIVPLGLPAISMWQAFSVGFMIEAFTLNSKEMFAEKKEEDKDFGHNVAKLFALSLVLLLTWGIAALIF